MDNDQRLLHTLLDISCNALLATDASLRVLAANQRFRSASGLAARQLEGSPLLSLFQEGSDPLFVQQLHATLRRDTCWFGTLQLRQRTEGSRAELRMIADSDGVPNHYLLILFDLARIDTPVGELLRQTQSDRVTGLPDRLLFADRLERALLQADRSQQSVVLLQFGLDHFNRINDALGYHVGNQVLREVANRLQRQLRRSDTVARLDGDQFALLISISHDTDTVIVAQKLLAVMQPPILINHQELSLTASIGIALYPHDADNSEGLLHAAASAMHHAKQGGRNGYHFFSRDLNQRARQRLTIENELRHALEHPHQQLVLHYQPKVETKSGTIVGAEALVRWQHPQRGLLPPSEFITVAEESGLITQLGDWVLQQACFQSASWRRSGLRPVRISVNVAAPQLRAERLPEQVAQILAKSGLSPDCLELELTESMLISHPERVAQQLQRLRQLGIHIALDDFGTGYSSLSYLTRFPLTTLKIDRSFVRDLDSDQSMAEVTRAIIDLSRSLNLEVVAEGAETANQIAFLQHHGCVTVQGFFYSRPLPPEQFSNLLRDGIPPSALSHYPL